MMFCSQKRGAVSLLAARRDERLFSSNFPEFQLAENQFFGKS
jgi:hypothetical protein